MRRGSPGSFPPGSSLLRPCPDYCARLFQRDDLPRIHDVVRIERPLDRAHGAERRRRRARPRDISSCPAPPRARRCRCRPSRARARPAARTDSLAALDLVGIVHVDQQGQMKIAVADVAEDRRDQPARAMSRWVAVTHSASREIGTQTSVANACGARPQRPARPIGVVARLPQPRAVLRLGRPLERAAAELGGDLAETLATARRRRPALPWNSTNSIGTSGRVSLE